MAENDEPITMTQEELSALIHKSERKFRAAAVTDFKNSDEFSQAINSAVDEAIRKTQLTAEQKAEEERKEREKKEAEERRKFNHDKAVFETTKELTKRGLPVSFAETLADEDPEKTNNNINQFESDFKKTVDDRVLKETQGSNTPKAGSGIPDKYKGKKISDMSYEERVAFRRDSPEAYDEQYKAEHI